MMTDTEMRRYHENVVRGLNRIAKAVEVMPNKGMYKSILTDPGDTSVTIVDGHEGEEMKLRDFLLTKPTYGDFILLRDKSRQICCAVVDNDKLFMSALDAGTLERKVESWAYGAASWVTKRVMIVDII